MTTHRKIIQDPPNSTLICTSECYPLKPSSINCIPKCILNDTYSSPPPSPPYTDGYIFTTPPQHHHRSSLSLPLKISIVILILTFSFFLLYTLYKFYTVWYRSRHRRQPPPSVTDQETNNDFLDHDVLDHPIWYIRTIGLQPGVISAITVVKYSKNDGLIEGVSCSVCLSEFLEDEMLRLLPKCNHAFHVSCIDTWLRSHTSCPLCRAGIVKSMSSNNINININVSNNNINNNSDLDEGEDRVTVLVTEEGSDNIDNINNNNNIIIDNDNSVGGSGMIRRSVSLNDYEACRVRSDVRVNVNNYYSDRHDVQIQPVDGGFGFDLVKVDRTANNRT